VYAHVPWTSPTLPFVWVAFHGPGFSEKDPDFAAVHMLFDLYFGPTSDLYKRLVQQEQVVDQLGAFKPTNVDPELPTISARVKKLEDTVAVRDAILKTMALAKAAPVAADRLREAKSNVRYAFARTLDNTDTIAAVLARYVRIRRSYSTLNDFYARLASLTPEDLQNAARKYFTDDRLVVTTLSKDPMPAAIASIPRLETFASSSAAPGAGAADLSLVTQKSALPQLMIKLQFRAGSARDPQGKEGLAALAASMVTDAGSKAMRIDEIRKAFFPIAGGFGAQTDKETTTFTMRIHRDNWKPFFDIVLPMLLEPGMRPEDFQRVRDAQRNALKQDLRSDNEEELAKETLQDDIYAGTPYGHPVLGTLAGIDAIGPDDVRSFWKSWYTRENVTVGINGAAPDDLVARLRTELGALPAGGAAAPASAVAGRKPSGLEVQIIEKDTRATAISFGHPIEVTRSHPDFAALSVARSWLGEHRASTSHLYQRIREARGMNYGDYAYIEAFPGGMFAMQPNPNVARRAQLFEIWIRPVVPVNAHMAIRVALHELQKLVENGMSAEDFQKTREYLSKNVFLMTANQNQQLGYALDSKFYGTGDFAATMREKLAALKLEDVNAAIRKHLSFQNLSFVIVTKDAKGLRDQLLADGVSPIQYDADKPQALLDEDKVIGSRKLGLKPESVKIVPVEQVFAK
jgi:zinc protease